MGSSECNESDETPQCGKVGYWFLEESEYSVQYILKNRKEEEIEINVDDYGLQLYVDYGDLRIVLSKDEEMQLQIACIEIIQQLKHRYIMKQLKAVDEIGEMKLDWRDESNDVL